MSMMSGSTSMQKVSVQQQIVRFKYRPAAVQPEMRVVGDAGHVAKNRKKVKKVEFDEDAGKAGIEFEQPTMFPEHTQLRRTVKVIYSDEVKFRSTQQPTVFERIQKQKKWLEHQEMELRREALQQKMVDTMYEKDHNIETGPEGEDGDITIEALDNDVFGVLDVPGEERDPHAVAARECMLQIVAMKEKRFARTRNTRKFHKPLKGFARYNMAIGMYFGGAGVPQRRNISEIMPWLLIGGREAASENSAMLSSGITHIVNMTEDIKNAFDDMFVYIQFPLKDNDQADMSKYFQKGLEFFKRVESCKGKVLVHCEAGASRAPSMVLAYLVIGRYQLTLADAYNYVKARRPQVLINRAFLTQLAQLEIDNFGGCSVLFHSDWNYYEFNVIKGMKPDFRESRGMYKTVQVLYGKHDWDD